MKKSILTIALFTTLFLPVQAQIQNGLLEMHIPFDLEIENETLEKEEGKIDLVAVSERCVILDYVLADIPVKKSSEHTRTPKFLDSLHLYYYSKTNSTHIAKSATSWTALTLNTTTENTLFPWLNSVPSDNKDIHNQQHIPNGFGPLIRI